MSIYPHYLQNNLDCDNCHDIHGSQPKLIWAQETPQHIDDSPFNQLCWSCHCEPGSETCYETHSSRQADAGYGNWTVQCVVCHEPHFQMQAVTYTGTGDYVAEGTISLGNVTATSIKKTGAADWEVDAFAGMKVYPSTTQMYTCYKIIGNSADTLYIDPNAATDGVDGESMDLDLINEGDTFVISYGKLIWTPIDLGRILDYPDPGDLEQYTYPKSGIKTVKFVRTTGLNSYADADETYDGICEVCHTRTNYHRNDGTADKTHNPATRCTRCHSHSNGFMHGTGSVDCQECHGHEAGSLYGSTMAFPNDELGGTSQGKGSTWSHSTHTEDDSDDKLGPLRDSGGLKPIYCDTCHDTANMPLFKNRNGSGNHSLAETDICDNCHSPGGTYDGVAMAKANWHNDPAADAGDGIYWNDTGVRKLKAGREKWCAGCHDEEPAYSLADGSGISAPNVIGDEDGDYTYGTGWGYYKTGHGLPADEPYPSKGGFLEPALKDGVARAVNCDSCHDFSAAHIDGLERTYDDGNSSDTDPGEYRQGYRLRLVNGQEPMQIPWKPEDYGTTIQESPPNNADRYRLCAECHVTRPFTTNSMSETNFVSTRDLDGTRNRHYTHVNNFVTPWWSSDWDGTINSRIICVSCHNVHGSTRLAMVRDGELIDNTMPANKGKPGLVMWYYNDDTVVVNEENNLPPVPEDTPLAGSDGTIWWPRTSAYLCGMCHSQDVTVKEPRNPFQDVMMAPSLDWTGESGYVSDGADPDAGVTGSTFTFRVKYIDPNNNGPVAPGYINLLLDTDNDGSTDGTYPLGEDDSGDENYLDGKMYARSLVLSDVGTIAYSFAAQDETGLAAAGPPAYWNSVVVLSSGIPSANAPVLTWTGENGYADDGSNPDSGSGGETSFVFRVDYTDADDNPPVLIQVWIDEDDNGAYSPAEKFDMNEVNGGDFVYTDGKRYQLGRVLNYSGDGLLQYRFYAMDGSLEANGDPTGEKSVSLTNSVPFLSWTGAANYTGDGVHPDSGAGGTEFVFAVKYSDGDNVAPDPIQVWVDTDNSGVYDAHEKYDMAEVDSGDTVYTDGKEYTKTLTIPYIGDGAISYRFYASDGADPATGDPVSDIALTITTPSASNNVPQLSWTSADCLTEGVRPAVGADDADFEFKVIYTDPDPVQCAADILLLVDQDDSNTYGPDEKYVLTGDAGDTDCTDGRLYEATVNLEAAGDGELNYSFYATDGYVAAIGSPTGDSTVTVLDALKVRPSGGAGWLTTIQSAVDNSTNPSTILVYPEADFTAATYVENIEARTKNLTVRSVCGPDLTIIDGGGSGICALLRADNQVLDGFGVTNATDGVWLNPAPDNVTIKNNKIYGNSQYGINVNLAISVSIENNEIYNNSSRGIMVNNGVPSVIKNCDIHDNGGGIYFNGGVQTITDSVFWQNVASAGGGIYFNGTQAGTTVTGTTIRDNTVTGGGGGLHVRGKVEFDRCVITGNSAGSGGGIYAQNSGTKPTFKNSIIAYNQADNGGAATFVTGTTGLFFNATFANNEATVGYGGVFWACGIIDRIQVRNSIFWENAAAQGVDIASRVGCGPTGILLDVSYSDLDQSEVGGDSILTNNIDPAEDPLFTGDGSYRILEGSPCIDAIPFDDFSGPDDDFDGRARPQNVDYDMGAYEFPAAAGSNNAPVLDWTGEPNFDEDGVHPDSGISEDTVFEFRVSYRDAENEAPLKIQVWVDEDGNGIYFADEKFDLNEVDGDAVYTDGKIYTFSQPLYYIPGGVLKYRFYATDGTGNATGDPALDTHSVAVASRLPIGGFVDENVIPAEQVFQSGSGDGVITINWKGKDAYSYPVTLHSFEYSVDSGTNWNTPVNGDASEALAADWEINSYTTAPTFTDADVHSFTFNTMHADATGFAGIDQSDVQVRFTLHDGTDDSAAPVTSESFRVDNEPPTDTFVSAAYDATLDTLTITGTGFTTVASSGTDIKTYVDWTKFVWDINDDDAITADITFAVDDVASLTVTNESTLTLVFTAAKGDEIEAAEYGSPGGEDTLFITAGFSKDAFGNAAASDGNSNVGISVN